MLFLTNTPGSRREPKTASLSLKAEWPEHLLSLLIGHRTASRVHSSPLPTANWNTCHFIIGYDSSQIGDLQIFPSIVWALFTFLMLSNAAIRNTKAFNFDEIPFVYFCVVA